MTVVKARREQEDRLLLKLRQLWAEPAMRRAWRWWREEFVPKSAEDYLQSERVHGTREQDWLQSVLSYWEMACALVLNGALSRKTFLTAAASKDLFEVFGKVRPFLGELRRKQKDPQLLRRMEKVMRSAYGVPAPRRRGKINPRSNGDERR